MQKLAIRGRIALCKFSERIKRIMKNDDGDQITGWLIVGCGCRSVLPQHISGYNR